MTVPSAERADANAGYTLGEHRHRFAVWAAARAAQRGLKGAHNVVLAEALESCGVRDVVDAGAASWPTEAAQVDSRHAQWCSRIVDGLQAGGVAASYGRAAKLVAIYLKVTVIGAGFHETPFGRHLHPPIDDILLKALAAEPRFAAQACRRWRATRWTKLEAVEYAELVRSLRDAGLDVPGFWMVERYWLVRRAIVSG